MMLLTMTLRITGIATFVCQQPQRGSIQRNATNDGKIRAKSWGGMAHPTGFEPVASAFGGQASD